jgi:DNA primase
MTLLELISRYSELRKVASTDGGEFSGSCPACGGQDRFRVWPYADRPRFWCRQCGRKGDAIQFLRDFERLTYREARERLGLPVDEQARVTSARPLPKVPPQAWPPSKAWQAKARAFTEACERTLWTGEGAKARAYLHGRGLSDDTIRTARLGYHAAETWEEPEAWGIASDHKKMALLRGIVIPWYVGGAVWRVQFRRDGYDIPKHARYQPIAGGGQPLYRIDTVHPNQPAMIVEGALDALAIVQEAGDLVAAVAAGSTGDGRRERWIGRLSLASTVLLGFDADDAGDKAASWWQEALGARAKRWRPYWDDPNTLLQVGVNLRTWIREGLEQEPHWWRDMARWPEDRREEWGERSSIMAIDGGLSRDAAEQEAYALLAERPK